MPLHVGMTLAFYTTNRQPLAVKEIVPSNYLIVIEILLQHQDHWHCDCQNHGYLNRYHPSESKLRIPELPEWIDSLSDFSLGI
jgi:hypothetical protein